MPASLITVEEFRDVLREGMPAAAAMPFEVAILERGLAVLRLVTGPRDHRPGGTVAGPVLFWFADLAMYAAVMSAVGKVPLAVTTDATIHYLRRPLPGPLVARARVIKQGKRLVVGEVTVAVDGQEDSPVAHAVMTYSVPPRRPSPEV
jgi:uncharacterized protein (TIGR00369 family)